MEAFGKLAIDFNVNQLYNQNIFIASLKYLRRADIANAMNSHKGCFSP